MGKTRKVIKAGIKAVIAPKHTAREFQKAVGRREVNYRRQREYQAWYAKQEMTASQLAEQRAAAHKLAYRPLVSILVPLYNAPENFLRECIDSVLAQTYDNWELCVADDASTTNILDVVKEYAAKHKNVKYTRLATNQHIAMSSNEALKLATGEFVALLDNDDLLTPNALYESVLALNNNRKADLVYSDEDKFEAGVGQLEPFFKPDWSPDFLRSCNYITHFAVLRRSIMEEIGGFRYGTEGAQDWDLFLRFTQKTKNIVHVPKILYTWRKSPTSTAKTANSKPYAYINQKRVLREAAGRVKTAATVHEHVSLGFWRFKYEIQGFPKVSIVVPTKNNLEYIKRCMESVLEQTNYPNFEVVIVDTGSTDKAVFDFYESKLIKSSNVKIVHWKGATFNYSSACNFGVKHSDGDYVALLNDDIEVIASDWIEGLLEHAQRPEVGMVGGKLLFPNEHIQHAGVVVCEQDIAFHPFYNMDPKHDIFTYIFTANIRNVAAVTAACSMVSRKKFDAVGGFDEKLRVTYNDVDLNLKLLDQGLFNIYTPYVEMYHHESISIGKITGAKRDKGELEAAQALMRKRYGKTYLARDPYYNDNFQQHGPGYELA